MNAISRPENPGNRPHQNVIAEWLAMLGRLVAPSFPDDAAVRFSAYAPLLSALPVAAFNAETLDDAARCATARNGFPTYAEVHTVLAAWVAERRPIEPNRTTPITCLPRGEKCTPDQAAAVLERHGWTRRGDKLAAPFASRRADDPAPTPRYVTGEALAELRRRAGIRVPTAQD